MSSSSFNLSSSTSSFVRHTAQPRSRKKLPPFLLLHEHHKLPPLSRRAGDTAARCAHDLFTCHRGVRVRRSLRSTMLRLVCAYRSGIALGLPRPHNGGTTLARLSSRRVLAASFSPCAVSVFCSSVFRSDTVAAGGSEKRRLLCVRT